MRFGGGSAIEHTFGGLRQRDWSARRPFPLREITGRRQTRGERVTSERGVQERFRGGLSWYVFSSPGFSTPLCRSLTSGNVAKQDEERP